MTCLYMSTWPVSVYPDKIDNISTFSIANISPRLVVSRYTCFLYCQCKSLNCCLRMVIVIEGMRRNRRAWVRYGALVYHFRHEWFSWRLCQYTFTVALVVLGVGVLISMRKVNRKSIRGDFHKAIIHCKNYMLFRPFLNTLGPSKIIHWLAPQAVTPTHQLLLNYLPPSTAVLCLM